MAPCARVAFVPLAKFILLGVFVALCPRLPAPSHPTPPPASAAQGNELDAVPEALAACTSLCELWLGGFSGKEPAGNLLTSLPPALSSLTALEKLNLHFNSFEEFPMVVCELGASLRHLYLTSNVLISLPDDISRLSSLEQVGLRAVPPCGVGGSGCGGAPSLWAIGTWWDALRACTPAPSLSCIGHYLLLSISHGTACG